MTGNNNSSKQQDNNNVENFVRENTRMIVKHSVEKPNNNIAHRLYKCKDCDKQYDSFQALGGHRASHRPPKQQVDTKSDDNSTLVEPHSELKLHQCKICNKGFEIGQSLGGHMRKHWRKTVVSESTDVVVIPPPVDSSSSSSSSSASNGDVVVFKYDLNFTPHENELTPQQDSSSSA